ncbi:dTDP-4-amino-4,6-dideoxygalactose transaminase [Clostridiaceae bacterium 35-E11]
MMKIPFYIPYYTGEELQYIQEAMNKHQISGDGLYTDRITGLLEKKFQVKKAFMITSATHALEIATMLIDLQPGDEVIMPSFTFPSTANAVLLRGAKPVFCEIDENTLNIDPKKILEKITPKTKAIIPVHYAGIGCDMDKIMDIAKSHHLHVIEDAAQAVNAKYKDKYLGTWGDIGCYSFHGTKNFTSGEGGAILLNTNDESLIKKVEMIRQKGTNRNQFVRGEIDAYTWMNIGSSYVPSDILMAFLYAQLKGMDMIMMKRKKIHDYYCHHLKEYIDAGIIKTAEFSKDYQPNYHLFYLLFQEERIRDKVKQELMDRGIATAIHFMPLHSSPMGQRLGYVKEDLPITEKTSETLLRLPMYTSMSEKELDYVMGHLKSILKKIGEI